VKPFGFALPDVRILKVIRMFSSKDDTRFILNGVHFSINFRTQSLTIVATDGRALLAHTTKTEAIPKEAPEGWPATVKFTLPNTLIDHAMRMQPKGKKPTKPTMQISIETPNLGARVTLQRIGDETAITGSSVNKEFPKWREVVPSNMRTMLPATDAVSAIYISLIADAAAALGDITMAFTLWQTPDSSMPLIVKHQWAVENMLCLIMPLRVGAKDNSPPDTTAFLIED
jgi:hypothetical protein